MDNNRCVQRNRGRSHALAKEFERIRAMDDLEVTKEYRPNPDRPDHGRLKFQFSAKGHEIPQLVAAALLNHPRDGATVYYRSRPLMLGVGLSLLSGYVSWLGSSLQLPVALAILVLVLLVRPAGLFGRVVVRRV